MSPFCTTVSMLLSFMCPYVHGKRENLDHLALRLILGSTEFAKVECVSKRFFTCVVVHQEMLLHGVQLLQGWTIS